MQGMNDLWQELLELVDETLGVSPALFNKFVLTISVLIVMFIVRWVIGQVFLRRIQEMQRRYIARKTCSYITGFIVLVLCIRIWLGNVGNLVAYFGILSAGLAVALKDPLTNFAGWIFLTTQKPFVVGDRIQIGRHAGDVIDIRLFQFTMVEIGNWVDADQSTGRIIHLPNGQVFTQTQANFTQGFNFIWNELPVIVTFESNWEKAKQILLDIAERQSAIQGEQAAEQVRHAARKYMIFFQQLTPIVWTSVADIGVTLTIRYLCEPRKRRSSAERIWEEILRSFAKCDDIDFAYPTSRFYNNVIEGKPGARANPGNGDGQGGETPGSATS